MLKHLIWIFVWVLIGASFSNWIHKYITVLPEM